MVEAKMVDVTFSANPLNHVMSLSTTLVKRVLNPLSKRLGTCQKTVNLGNYLVLSNLNICLGIVNNNFQSVLI